MHFQVSNFSFLGQQRKLHDNENFLNYGIEAHAIGAKSTTNVPDFRYRVTSRELTFHRD